MDDLRTLSAVVMAAGLGTRMRSATPKHLHPLLGRRMVDWVLAAVEPLGPEPLVVVASPETADGFGGAEGPLVAVQEQPRGTGDAMASARGSLDGVAGDVLVLSGDTPLVTSELLRALVDGHRAADADVTVLSLVLDEPGDYGRVVRDGSGNLAAIVEAKDAAPAELAVSEVNSSIYVFKAPALWEAIDRLEPHNAQRELYLTDCVRHIVDRNGVGHVVEAPDPELALGVNTRIELAQAADLLRQRINEAHMLAGVTIVDPASTWIEADVQLEADVTIHPFTVIRGDVRVARGVEIGPFCYLRPGTVLDEEAKAGTFVEVKNSHIGARTKVPHLSYVGDADIGEDANIAAGNITANFPHEEGRGKQRTTIGRNVRTGVDNAFLAPVTIGDNAWVAAGSVITEDVPPGALAIARARQENKEGYAGGNRHD
jgi:bifunctional UDP-N-acetylglucosamine pyrophosphorylase / glucosamine-1-phosphate N-acetyltransferase